MLYEVITELPANGSLFVVFDAVTSQTKVAEHFTQSENLKFKTAWKVRFETTQQTVSSYSLFDWSKSDNPEIKYYSGTAVYDNTFEYKGKASQVMLGLGEVCNLATVKINGIA